MQDRDNIGFYIKWLSENMTRNMNKRLKDIDLTYSQMRALMYLLKHKNETVIQKDIEKFLGLTHSTVIGLLQRMEKKGLIYMETNPTDHRCRIVKPCEKAFKIGDKILKIRELHEAEITKNLTPSQVEELKKLLKTVCKSVDLSFNSNK